MTEPPSRSELPSDHSNQEAVSSEQSLEREQETLPGAFATPVPAGTEPEAEPETGGEGPGLPEGDKETQETQETEAGIAAKREAETDSLSPEAASETHEGDTQKLGDSIDPEPAPVSFKQGLAAAALRDVGQVRETNQDNVFALLTTLPRGGVEMTAGLFVVADGMGGHESGDIASQLAVRAVVRHILSHWLVPTLDDEMMDDAQSLMVSAVQEANRAIWEYAEREHQDMGSTCTAVLLVGESIYIAHVGDTRVYLFGEGNAQAITTDHSAVGRLIELGHLEPSASRDHPLRNQLYRAIGQQPEVEVDFIYQHIGESTHILLCSDGLWGLVTEEELAEVLAHSPWPQGICQELIALANMRGGDDNISAVVVTLPVAEGLFEGFL